MLPDNIKTNLDAAQKMQTEVENLVLTLHPFIDKVIESATDCETLESLYDEIRRDRPDVAHYALYKLRLAIIQLSGHLALPKQYE
jgi:hypothetical protein